MHPDSARARWRGIGLASLRLLASAGMQAEAVEFFTHCETGDAEPAGGLGLVTLGEVDGLGEKLALGGFD
jgi:hypothetical protein